MKTAAIILSLAGILILILDCPQGAIIRCFKKMKAKTGSFNSPLYPSPYPSNEFCEYVIRAEADFYIEITFSHFKLEPVYKGEKTDYIKILDGGNNNRQREITYDGSQTGGFTYSSLTPKVTIHFHSDGQFGYVGFYATYRMIRRKCAVPQVENGNVQCEFSTKGHARTCELTCDDTYVPEGGPKFYCQGNDFNEDPRCIPDPSIFCNMEEIQHLPEVNCQEDPVTGGTGICTFGCPRDYFPPENNEVVCIDGIWDHIPECKPRPTVDCDLAEAAGTVTDCERDPVTNVITKCGFRCNLVDNPFYVPVNELVCNNGTWGEAVCIPNPDIMEECLNGTLLVKDEKVADEEEDAERDEGDCPFNAQERESYAKAFFDDLGELEELADRARGSGVKQFKCKPKFCWIRRDNKKPVVNCYNYSLKMQRKFGLNDEQRVLHQKICLKCRLESCSRPARIFA